MGAIKVWDIQKEEGDRGRWISTLRDELGHHRTRVNELRWGGDSIWTGGDILSIKLNYAHLKYNTASADETAQIVQYPTPPPTSTGPANELKPTPPLGHPKPVRSILPLSLTAVGEPYLITGSGDLIYVYDLTDSTKPELLGAVEAHWHDVTSLRLWARTVEGGNVEPWIISGSLDGTIRKWRLSGWFLYSDIFHGIYISSFTPIDLLDPKSAVYHPVEVPQPEGTNEFMITEEEERELAELMD